MSASDKLLQTLDRRWEHYGDEYAKDAAARIRELEQRCEAMRSIVFDHDAVCAAAGDEDPLALIEAAKRLPLTADGVRVTVGTDVYARDGSHAGLWMCLGTTNVTLNIGDPTDLWEGHVISECYSTREAAEAARNTNG